MKEKILPYQSCSRSLFFFLGIILILWGVFFSLLLISFGAWPITIFLGVEYLLLVYLIIYYFKGKDIGENIIINSNIIKIEKIKNKKIFKTINFKTYWSKVQYYRIKNKSKLIIRESSKEEELVSFLHADLKEVLYKKIKKNIN